MQGLDQLDRPIAMAELPGLEATLDNLQGHILRGHGRAHSAHIFLRFYPGQARAARDWIATLAAESYPSTEIPVRITSAQRQLQEARDHKLCGISDKVFCSFFLSARGYEALEIPILPEDKAFRQGMSSRRTFAGGELGLHDPPLADWAPDYQHKVHAMLLLAAPDEHMLRSAVQAVKTSLSGIATCGPIEYGRVRHNAQGEAIGHFGYVHGRSQPLFFEAEVEADRAQAECEPAGLETWDAAAGPALVLVRDPNGDPDHTGVPAYGSYLVFRKLGQDVDGFNAALAKLADALGLETEARQRAAALVMGRFRDGTPLVLQGNPGLSKPIPNHFTFSGDPQGLKCPFQAHIRKMNPRGERDRVVARALMATSKQLAVIGEDAYDSQHSPLAEPYRERSHRIARRSAVYGIHKEEQQEDPGLTPTCEVGVLFMCYQKDIRQQFEFLQANWANNADAPAQDTAPDAMIGQPGHGQAAQAQHWPRHWNRRRKDSVCFAMQSFVTLRGGEYFFAPSLSFLRNITRFPGPSGA